MPVRKARSTACLWGLRQLHALARVRPSSDQCEHATEVRVTGVVLLYHGGEETTGWVRCLGWLPFDW